MTNSRIMLVNAPSSEVRNAGNYAAFSAVGTVSLATRIRNAYPRIELRVMDGGIRTAQEIREEMDSYRPSLVGISVLTPTYTEGLELAEYAKRNHGSKTVLGNDHASFFPEMILANRPYVDYVVRAEIGEIPIVHIVEKEFGLSPGIKVPGYGEEAVYFRNAGKIQSAQFPKSKLSDVYQMPEDIPDLGFIEDDMKIIKRNYNMRYGRFHLSERTPVVVNNVRGCGNGELRCTYCSIYDLSLNAGSPEFFWQTVKYYNKNYGINFFFEACDSFLTFQKYIRDLIETMPFDPKERDIELEVYARANDIANVDASINWLRKLNVTRVNLGLDSGDDNMLRFLRKGNKSMNALLSPSQINYEAVKRLAEAGITVHASFPFGSLGETYESLESTLTFIEQMAKDYGNSIATLEASELVPLPNSPSWDILLSREIPVFEFAGGIDCLLGEAGIELNADVREYLILKYGNRDLLGITELAKDWTKYFTHIRWEDVEKAKETVENIAKSIGAVYGQAF